MVWGSTSAAALPSTAAGQCTTNSDLTSPLGIVVLVTLAISAISTGAMICLLVYVRKLMVRLANSDAKREANHRIAGDDMRQLTAMIAQLQGQGGHHGSGDSLSDSRRGSWQSDGGGVGGAGLTSAALMGQLRGEEARYGSNGGLSDSGYSSTGGYSSGEDLTSEEHLSTARRTIKRTLSNSSIQSMRISLANTNVRDSLSKNDLDSLMFMFGDAEDGVSC